VALALSEPLVDWFVGRLFPVRLLILVTVCGVLGVVSHPRDTVVSDASFPGDLFVEGVELAG
jgi:hypothetical protein